MARQAGTAARVRPNTSYTGTRPPGRARTSLGGGGELSKCPQRLIQLSASRPNAIGDLRARISGSHPCAWVPIWLWAYGPDEGTVSPLFPSSRHTSRGRAPFPPALRKVVYTTNSIESLNYQLRKIIKNRGHFPRPSLPISSAATNRSYLLHQRHRQCAGPGLAPAGPRPGGGRRPHRHVTHRLDGLAAFSARVAVVIFR